MNEEKDSITIYRYPGEGSFGIDTESAEYGEILINDDKGFYSTKNGKTTLVFIKYGNSYKIIGNIDLSEIVKIAEKIK